MELLRHLVKSLSNRQREKEDIELQRFAINRKRSSKRFSKQMDDDVEMAEALGLCGVILDKKARLQRSQNKE